MRYEEVVKNKNKEWIIDYGVYGVTKCGNTYYFIDNEDQTCDEVDIIAKLDYDVNHEPIDKVELHRLFDCAICGEYVYDDGISYIWFDYAQ